VNKESTLIAVVALIVGLLGGYLVFSISNAGKSQQPMPAIQSGAGSPTDYVQRIAQAEKIVAQDPKKKAINAYGKALEIDPNNPNVLTDQGVMFRKVGWFDKALANFEKANKIDSNHLQSLFNSGIVYVVDLKQPEKALPFWNKYLKMDANSPTALQIKEMMGQMGKGAPPKMK
jgi:tetratricopeptide (TPR) repeat protein